MKSIPRTRPWNRVDQNVYSIASFSNGRHNMNICTYATPISLKPKLYMVAIYKKTLTEQLVKDQSEFVLQFLSVNHANLIQLLGRTSGFHHDKLKNIPELQSYQQFMLLPGLPAFVHLKVNGWVDSGDHSCAMCEVIGSKNLSSGRLLTTGILRKKKLIRG